MSRRIDFLFVAGNIGRRGEWSVVVHALGERDVRFWGGKYVVSVTQVFRTQSSAKLIVFQTVSGINQGGHNFSG